MSTEAAAAPPLRDRESIPDRFKWNLTNIFPDWDAWQAAYDELDRKIDEFAALQGTLGRRRRRCSPRCGCATRSVSSNTRCGTSRRSGTTRISATTRSTRSRQQVQILFAKAAQASAWFDPELLQIPLATVQAWMAADAGRWRSTGSRIEDLYRQQEHVLDDKGEHLLSLSSRFSSSPNDAYAALSTADVKYPTVRLSTGAEATLTYGQYRAILATNRNQADRAAAFHEFHKIYDSQRQHLRVALQRRAAARLVPRAGARLRDRRSTRRCTATTSRRRSSRT